MATPSSIQKTTNQNATSSEIHESEPMIYATTYKKGNLLQHLHFRFNGPLTGAIAKIKAYCYRHHLMHIHTVPFLVNLDEPAIDDTTDQLNSEDWIDVTS
jgi:hypothetical protein